LYGEFFVKLFRQGGELFPSSVSLLDCKARFFASPGWMMTIRGEPACRARSQSRHNLVFGGSKDPNHDAVMRIGSEAPRRRTHSLLRRYKPSVYPGYRHLEPSSATVTSWTDWA
jgi:hypothetical protein